MTGSPVRAGRACGWALLQSAYVWHLCMCVSVRARGRSGARRPAGVGHEGAHHSPLILSLRLGTRLALSRPSAASACSRPGQACNDLARLGAPADPGRHPGPPVQSLPVKQAPLASPASVTSPATAWPRVRAPACIRARRSTGSAPPARRPCRCRADMCGAVKRGR
jgi:hypothetical protein